MGSALSQEERKSPFTARRSGKIRVMVVDDSITARSALVRTIESRTDMQVVATAGSAEVALEMLDNRTVHVILLDLEMPGMGGLKALPQILAKANGARVCVVSTLTTAGAEPTVAALAMGAADTLAKPRTGAFSEAYRAELAEKIIALADVTLAPVRDVPAPVSRPARVTGLSPAVIALGASTGGIHALGRFFGGLSPTVQAPVLVTQHLPAAFMPVFARQIAAMSGRPAVIADSGTRIEPGKIFIAPGDGHLMLRQDGDHTVSHIADFAVASGCRPSVDPMFESIAEFFGPRGLGVVLSGMGRDGTVGAQALRDAGGTLMAQDEESCAVFGMPRGIVEAGLAAHVATPEDLAASIGMKREPRDGR